MSQPRRLLKHHCRKPKVSPWWGTYFWKCPTCLTGWNHRIGTLFVWQTDIDRRSRWFDDGEGWSA